MKIIKNYIIGFVLAYTLTGISFLLALTSELSRSLIVTGIVIAGALQLIVHLYYFLHLNNSQENRFNMISLVFAFLLVGFFIGGTIWVIMTLNMRMM